MAAIVREDSIAYFGSPTFQAYLNSALLEIGRSKDNTITVSKNLPLVVSEKLPKYTSLTSDPYLAAVLVPALHQLGYAVPTGDAIAGLYVWVELTGRGIDIYNQLEKEEATEKGNPHQNSDDISGIACADQKCSSLSLGRCCGGCHEHSSAKGNNKT